MAALKEIEKRIRLKEDEIRNLEQRLWEARAYVDAMRESIKLITKESGQDQTDSIRAGSLVDLARRYLQLQGQPMHVDKILIGIGKENTKSNKVALSGSLGHYTRQNIVFTRPAPNTFGLKDFEEQQSTDLPPDFGKD